MKTANWARYDHLLAEYGFYPDKIAPSDKSIRWFIYSGADAAVSTCLRLTFKPKMQVLAAHWGWSHRGAREFCLEALRSDWKRGFAWLNEASVTQAPCLRMFNLAGYFKWSLGGMPVGEVEGVYGSAESDFRKVLASGQWVVNDPASLLENFITDTSPFNWRVDNAALRLAEIGGLSKALGLGAAEFDRCAELHQQSIDAGMFGLGSSDAWITSLRKKLTAQ